MTTYNIDTAHSEIGFSVRHMVFAKVRGQFKTWTAKLAYDPARPASSTLQVEVDVASIDTRESQRDGHLRSADFFDAERFPKMVFESRHVEKTGEGEFKVTGDFTMHGVTGELVLDVEATGAGKDPWGNERLGFRAKGSLSRSKWGLTWNQALETGGVLVSDKVELEVEVQVVATAPVAVTTT